PSRRCDSEIARILDEKTQDSKGERGEGPLFLAGKQLEDELTLTWCSRRVCPSSAEVETGVALRKEVWHHFQEWINMAKFVSLVKGVFLMYVVLEISWPATLTDGIAARVVFINNRRQVRTDSGCTGNKRLGSCCDVGAVNKSAERENLSESESENDKGMEDTDGGKGLKGTMSLARKELEPNHPPRCLKNSAHSNEPMITP
ncbi:hypothetical protein U0070_009920, partial [Myodes glareolus]